MKRLFQLILISFLICFPLALIGHFWFTDWRGVMKMVYPAQSIVSDFGLECSENSPGWLKDVSRSGVWGLKALSTQVAFINLNDEIFHCESGWENGFLSRSVSVDSKFYYGSMTKPITVAGLLHLKKEAGFSLSVPVPEYFRSDKYDGVLSPGNSASLDDFMRHTSGIKGEIFLSRTKPWCPYNVDDLRNFVFDQNVKGSFRYSNLGYCVLGEVLAKEMNTDYRGAIESLFGLKEREIFFVNEKENDELVRRDYRYNDFYGPSLPASFDFYAISSTGGMAGSASSYARLIRDLLSEDYEDFVTDRVKSCDSDEIRKCYGRAFYLYEASSGELVNVKEGYFPGSAGVVIINSRNEVLVWLGNSDTDNAARGERMKDFLDYLINTEF